MLSNLGKKIKTSGLSKREVARRVGVSHKTVVGQCRDGVWKITTAARYAKVLGCPVCKILGVGNVCNCGK